MEPNYTLLAVLNFAKIYLVPLASFGFGVVMSDVMRMHHLARRSYLYLMAVPVAMLTVGIMVSGARVEIELDAVRHVRFGHAEQFDKFLIFNATLIFYGTMVPSMFDAMRRRIMDEGDRSRSVHPL